MITRRICNLITLFISIFLLLYCHVNAQKLYYGNVDKADKIIDIKYITGKQDSNIVVWIYKIREKTLQINLYNNEMNLLTQSALNLKNADYLYSINFFRKDNAFDILVQYASKKSAVTQMFSFNKISNVISPSKVLMEANDFGDIIIKHSGNGKFTGLINGYNTPEDSVLIHYAIYNEQDERIQDINFILPQKYHFINLSSSVMDNAGNLFFNAAEDDKDAAAGGNIAIYEVNLNRDSLLVNNIFRNGQFSNVRIQQNNTTGRLNVSGVWTDENHKIGTLIQEGRKYLFYVDLDEDFSQQKEITLLPATTIIDSIYAVKSYLRSAELVLNKDSGYIFYIAGLTNSNKPAVQTYQKPYIPAQSSWSSNNPVNTYLSSNTYNSFRPESNTDPTFRNNEGNLVHWITTQGENIFITLSVNKNHISSIHNFKDSTPGNSFPEFEYIANTGKNIHYIYSRALKNNKQLIYDLVFEGSGHMHLNPVITNSKYRLLINEGVQAASNFIVFPYLNNQMLLFAKMDLE